MNGRSGIKVRFDKDFEKECYDSAHSDEIQRL